MKLLDSSVAAPFDLVIFEIASNTSIIINACFYEMYRLDIGEGKEVNLEKCPRSKLQSQCIKYLGPVSPSSV
jgi:hypothetical protein